jgi:hypothetical protein
MNTSNEITAVDWINLIFAIGAIALFFTMTFWVA